jgi:hypothetical protein
MKKIILTYILVIIAIQLPAQKYVSPFGDYFFEEHKYEKLFGNIREIKEEIKYEKAEKRTDVATRNNPASAYTVLNRNQNILYQIIKDELDSVIEKKEYTYFRDSLVLTASYLEMSYDSAGSVSIGEKYKDEYFYEEAIRLSIQKHFEIDDNLVYYYLDYIKTFSYTPFNKMAKTIIKYYDGEELDYEGCIVYAYNKNKLLIKEEEYTDLEQTNLIDKTKYDYDKKGRLNKEIIFLKNNNLKDSIVIFRKFDKKNRLIYSSNTRMENSKGYTGGVKDEKRAYTIQLTYTKSNFPTIVKYQTFVNDIVNAPHNCYFKYTLDQKGNWIRRETEYFNKTKEIVTRKISYYE